MSEHLHLAFVCGITTFPHDMRGHPLCCARRNEAVYPQYVPTEVSGPITEWQEAPLHEPVRVPLPNKATLLMNYQERHRDEMPQESTLTQWLDDRRMLLDLTIYDRLRKAVPAEFSETTGPQAMDVVYWQGWGVPDNSAANAGVIGYTVDSLPYNDTMAYVFGSIYPLISQAFAGHVLLPSIPLDQAGSADSLFLRFLIEQAEKNADVRARILQRSYWREAQSKGVSLRSINRQKQLIRDGHLYQHFHMEIDDILSTTMWIFNWMGLWVHKRDLKLMLCWHWG